MWIPWPWGQLNDIEAGIAANGKKLDQILIILADDEQLAKAAASLNASTEKLRAALAAQLKEK